MKKWIWPALFVSSLALAIYLLVTKKPSPSVQTPDETEKNAPLPQDRHEEEIPFASPPAVHDHSGSGILEMTPPSQTHPPTLSPPSDTQVPPQQPPPNEAVYPPVQPQVNPEYPKENLQGFPPTGGPEDGYPPPPSFPEPVPFDEDNPPPPPLEGFPPNNSQPPEEFDE